MPVPRLYLEIEGEAHKSNHPAEAKNGQDEQIDAIMSRSLA
jgi:hypothetical protein